MSGPGMRPGGPGGQRPPARPMGGPFGGVGLPPEKPKNMRKSLLRLAGNLRPELPKIIIVLIFAFYLSYLRLLGSFLP